MDSKEEVKLPPVTVEKVMSTLAQTKDWGLIEHNIPDVWKETQGEGVKIAVIDTGMVNHSDIVDNAVFGKNCIDGEDEFDANGHQTHCVGIICAKNNSTGMVGVAPKAKCICIKALSNSGSGSYNSLAAALEYCVAIKPDIVSMSLGGTNPSPKIHYLIKKLHKFNIPVVCAAGNSGMSGVNYPAAFPETIAVAAYDKYGKIAQFSSRGEEVDFSAPGVAIYSTYLNNMYARLSGTSMACPFIAGVIALQLSKWKSKGEKRTVDELKQVLIQFSDDKGQLGKDNDWGYGIIDTDRMILENADKDPVPVPEPAPEPAPEPKPDSWIRKNIAWVVLGVFVLAACIVAILNYNEVVDIPSPPFIDEFGEIDWDEKFNFDTR